MEHRRMEGSSLQLEVVRKVPELVVHERMSQGKGVKGFKKKRGKYQDGLWKREMKERPNIALEIDTEGMRKWRGLSQSEMDQCLKNLAGRMEEKVMDKYKVEESNKEAFSGRGAPLEWRRVRENRKYRIRKRSEDCWARTFSV